MPTEPMIACENLTKRFGHFTAVDQVSISVGKASLFDLRRLQGTSSRRQPRGYTFK